jgi:octaprenyl-diphosphate synthase
VIEDEASRKHEKVWELIGMAFQIKDDLFDYTEEAIGNQLVLI